MPAIVDSIVISRCNGTVNLGDKYNVNPQFRNKEYHGSGSSNAAKTVKVFNGVSTANVFDNDLTDQDTKFTL
ncbi:spore germination protein [Bacillus cereus group sp. BfR-BA-01380]|uniref:spore germination protein n=1 Tax=Bacillus cereus group sp. BfR-BA-01380 TaxID=2920324 RepID=UPI001F57000A|nr:spore germination protein [Bacillus cereus group sp. BfR-BA-01380]